MGRAHVRCCRRGATPAWRAATCSARCGGRTSACAGSAQAGVGAAADAGAAPAGDAGVAAATGGGGGGGGASAPSGCTPASARKPARARRRWVSGAAAFQHARAVPDVTLQLALHASLIQPRPRARDLGPAAPNRQHAHQLPQALHTVCSRACIALLALGRVATEQAARGGCAPGGLARVHIHGMLNIWGIGPVQRGRTREQREVEVLQLPLHAVHEHVLPGREQPRAPRVALQRAQRRVRAAHQQVRHAVERLHAPADRLLTLLLLIGLYSALRPPFTREHAAACTGRSPGPHNPARPQQASPCPCRRGAPCLALGPPGLQPSSQSYRSRPQCSARLAAALR